MSFCKIMMHIRTYYYCVTVITEKMTIFYTVVCSVLLLALALSRLSLSKIVSSTVKLMLFLSESPDFRSQHRD
jgi:hypothetical protein